MLHREAAGAEIDGIGTIGTTGEETGEIIAGVAGSGTNLHAGADQILAIGSFPGMS